MNPKDTRNPDNTICFKTREDEEGTRCNCTVCINDLYEKMNVDNTLLIINYLKVETE